MHRARILLIASLMFTVAPPPLRLDAATVSPFFTMPFGALTNAWLVVDVNGDGRLDLVGGRDLQTGLQGRSNERRSRARTACRVVLRSAT